MLNSNSHILHIRDLVNKVITVTKFINSGIPNEVDYEMQSELLTYQEQLLSKVSDELKKTGTQLEIK
jgi:hypothetical protein